MSIYFIGLGGVGVSALAKYYLAKGHKISGSSLEDSEITRDLKKRGAVVFTPPLAGQVVHKKENLPADADLIIHTTAISDDNPELLEAKKRGLKIQTYAQALGELTKQYFTIAVSGTHGKSTTTAMLALIMEKAGLDPTVIIGTKLKEWDDSNFRLGKSKYLLIEADEYRASFLNYWPKIIVLTNIEAEHLDYYKNLTHILKTFQEYIGHLSEDGILIVNKDDKNIKKIITNYQLPITNYFLRQKETIQIEKILKVPGKHNIYDALAAMAAARALGVPDKIIFKALAEFKGVWRRFEYRGKLNSALIFDDYGHHPTEIKATLAAAKEFMKDKKLTGPATMRRGKLWCVFQPHHFERFRALFNDFTKAFASADKVILTDIYNVPGREAGHSPRDEQELKDKFTKKLKNKVIYVPLVDMSAYLKQNLKKGDLVVLMGAGDIYNIKLKI